MNDRPQHLIIVTHPGQDGIDIFSAHHDRSDAETMFERLEVLLPGGASVSLIEVPETDGVVKGSKPVRKVECAPSASVPSQQAAQPAPPPPVQKQPYRVRTDEELEAATMRALNAGGSQIISSAILDDDEPTS